MNGWLSFLVFGWWFWLELALYNVLTDRIHPFWRMLDFIAPRCNGRCCWTNARYQLIKHLVVRYIWNVIYFDLGEVWYVLFLSCIFYLLCNWIRLMRYLLLGSKLLNESNQSGLTRKKLCCIFFNLEQVNYIEIKMSYVYVTTITMEIVNANLTANYCSWTANQYDSIPSSKIKPII